VAKKKEENYMGGGGSQHQKEDPPGSRGYSSTRKVKGKNSGVRDKEKDDDCYLEGGELQAFSEG